MSESQIRDPAFHEWRGRARWTRSITSPSWRNATGRSSIRAHVEAPTSEPGALMKCPFEFKQYGECGRWVSSVFPHMATCVDDMAFLMALQSKTNVHGPASYMMNTGFLAPGFPECGRVDFLRPGHAQ
jgi:hypothetical protein